MFALRFAGGFRFDTGTREDVIRFGPNPVVFTSATASDPPPNHRLVIGLESESATEIVQLRPSEIVEPRGEGRER